MVGEFLDARVGPTDKCTHADIIIFVLINENDASICGAFRRAQRYAAELTPTLSIRFFT